VSDTTPAPTPIPYRDDLEQEQEGEAQVIEDTIAHMRHTMEQAFELHRKATSGTHAKSHGIVTGSLRVHDDLPPELAQGLFARSGTYEIVMRYASEPGQIDPDTAKRARGVALKVLDVEGEKLDPSWSSQDFLFNTWPVLPDGDAASYLMAIQERDKHAGHHLRTDAATLARTRSPQALLFERTPNLHPVAHTYYSQAAFRHGEYVAKHNLRPVGPDIAAVADREVGRGDAPGVLKDWVRKFFTTGTATYELGVQLRTDADTMPVEDTSVTWPEETSPYRPVATLTLPPQETFSAARRTYAEDRMSWRIWNGLAAHRPLGSINRARRAVYAELSQWRHDENAVTMHDPRSLAEVPD